jgi:hypothetical protein
MGPPEQAQHAADIISDLLRSVQAGGPPGHGGGRGRGRGQGNWNMGPPGGLQEFTFTVPTMKTGLIIGKGEDPRWPLGGGVGSSRGTWPFPFGVCVVGLTGRPLVSRGRDDKGHQPAVGGPDRAPEEPPAQRRPQH